MFAEIRPQISTRANFQKATRSLSAAIAEIEAVVSQVENEPAHDSPSSLA
jgi:hypothetical protein